MVLAQRAAAERVLLSAALAFAGLALAKAPFNRVPAATYIDAGPGTKTLNFKHGGEFLQMRARTWSKTS